MISDRQHRLDLYSSAVVVLTKLEPFLVPSTLIYFDELGGINWPFRVLP